MQNDFVNTFCEIRCPLNFFGLVLKLTRWVRDANPSTLSGEVPGLSKVVRPNNPLIVAVEVGGDADGALPSLGLTDYS